MPRLRHGAFWLAAGGHAALLWPLMAATEQPPRLADAPVMTVSLLAAAPVPQAAPPAPPVVRPAAPQQPAPRPVPQPITRAAPEPSPVVLPPAAAPSQPAPTQPPTQPASVTSAAAAPAAAPSSETAAPAPVVDARFDAAYLNNPKPAYPPLARRLGEEGQVLLRAYVSADGKPEQIELRRSSGSPRLDAAAQDTVRRWRFVPARRGDTAVAAWVLIPINFRLDS